MSEKGQFPDTSGGFGTLAAMANELQRAATETTSEVLGPAGLAARAAEVAARQRSPETRRTHAPCTALS